jgi:hypothetical protein
MNQEELTPALPTADQFVKSPLRNRIKLKLNAPLEDVWAVVGDPGRMPEYSAGLRKVETKKDASGKCTGFICYFKPEQDGGPQTIHHVDIIWYQPGIGLASLDEEPNAFGLQQSLTLITLEAEGNKTILNWDMHFTSDRKETIAMNVSSLGQALNIDIAQNLINMFGGTVLVNFVEGK